eukprot:TRINITY_DN34872_c0_g1_i1.p1 TRINITY_DN34872_c0_g1~~TRINITY_DN34872_c0_g1_i1.p1  ORF type:complete len:411 (+),score=39.48 TRINITY_DN34872_c0_g1_i1:35-1234(+)
MTRRRVLIMAGVGCSMGLIGRLSLGKHENQQNVAVPQGGKIVVVGGGVAGLCASYQLACKGYNVELIEATKTLGGSGTRLSGCLVKDIPTYSNDPWSLNPKTLLTTTWWLNFSGTFLKNLLSPQPAQRTPLPPLQELLDGYPASLRHSFTPVSISLLKEEDETAEQQHWISNRLGLSLQPPRDGWVMNHESVVKELVKECEMKGVKVYLSKRVTGYTEDRVHLQNNEVHPCDAVVLCAGSNCGTLTSAAPVLSVACHEIKVNKENLGIAGPDPQSVVLIDPKRRFTHIYTGEGGELCFSTTTSLNPPSLTYIPCDKLPNVRRFIALLLPDMLTGNTSSGYTAGTPDHCPVVGHLHSNVYISSGFERDGARDVWEGGRLVADAVGGGGGAGGRCDPKRFF